MESAHQPSLALRRQLRDNLHYYQCTSAHLFLVLGIAFHRFNIDEIVAILVLAEPKMFCDDGSPVCSVYILLPGIRIVEAAWQSLSRSLNSAPSPFPASISVDMI